MLPDCAPQCVYEDANNSCAHNYILRPLLTILDVAVTEGRARRVFDLGCGNGFVADTLDRAGFSVSGVDTSRSGIAIANREHPHISLQLGSAYDDLRSVHGTFPIVISLEVVEHLYSPRLFASRLYDLLEPNGIAIVSTPYHGYMKNLMIAVTGEFDRHVNPLWDDGHIKFWSKRTLRQLLCSAGFHPPHFVHAGRVPWLAKSMIAVARKPSLD